VELSALGSNPSRRTLARLVAIAHLEFQYATAAAAQRLNEESMIAWACVTAHPIQVKHI